LTESGRKLRQEGAARLIPIVAPLASLALAHMELDEPVKIVPNVRPYPLYERLSIKPLSSADLVRVVKSSQSQALDPEVYSGVHLDQGISKLNASRASYLVASEEGRTLGAVGYLYAERDSSVRIVELIADDDAVKGGLLRRAVEQAEVVHQAELIEIDVSARHPRLQRTMIELGFLPVAYVPGMVFHNAHRWDVVRMVKLNVAWDLGRLELVPSVQAVYDLVTLPFIRRDAQRRLRQAIASLPAFHGLSALEMDFVVRIAEEVKLDAGAPLTLNGLGVILEGGLQGSLQAGERSYGAGECLGGELLLSGEGELCVAAGETTRLLSISQRPFNELIEHYPHLGVKLLRNFYRGS
jgi:hypothetical protein